MFGLKHRRHSVPALVGMVLLALAGVVVITALRLGARPARGTIAPPPPADTTQVASDTVPAQQHYSGQYLSFGYPGSYHQVPHQPSAGSLESIVFYSTDHSSGQLAVTVTRGRLDQNSGVILRRRQADVYNERAIPQGLMFTKPDNGGEWTAFVTHGDLLASLALTDPNGRDRSGDLGQVLASLTWPSAP
jgi:hypothetical protein